jgi:hypothetical protein
VRVAWLRGIRDQLDWVLGDRPESPLCHRTVGLPAVYDLTYEEGAANEIAIDGCLGRTPANPTLSLRPRYGEAIVAAIGWLRGEATSAPVDQEGRGPYDSRRV